MTVLLLYESNSIATKKQKSDIDKAKEKMYKPESQWELQINISVKIERVDKN